MGGDGRGREDFLKVENRGTVNLCRDILNIGILGRMKGSMQNDNKNRRPLSDDCLCVHNSILVACGTGGVRSVCDREMPSE